jgi:hypothetical protein
MKEIWKKYKLSITTLVFLVLLLALIFFLANPLVKRTKEKADDIQKKMLDNQVDREKVGRISQMEETDKSIRGKSGEIDAVLSRDDEVEFIKKLEKVADETGNAMTLVVDDINANSVARPRASAGKKDGEKSILESLSCDSYISMKINLEGNYTGLINFLNKLENFEHYVNIISLESRKSAEVSEEEVAVETPINGDIFSVPQSNASPNSVLQKKISKKEKDILSSTINIIVYTKK